MRTDLRRIKPLPSLIASHSFDLVVSNPPFRRLKSGRLSEGDEKADARHEIKLRLHEAGLSLGVATFSFIIGYFIRQWLGIDL